MSRIVTPDNFLRTQNDHARNQQQTDLALQRITTPQIFLDTQFLNGTGAGLHPVVDHAPIYIDTLSTPLAMTYTPVGNAWWEVSCHVGAVQIPTVVSYIDLIVGLTPGPALGASYTLTRLISGATHAYTSRLFALTGGTTYTITASWNTSGLGATYNFSADVLWINGKAWSR